MRGARRAGWRYDRAMKTKPDTSSSASEATPLPRKLGANHSDAAARPRKHHNNFKQSVDLREDRGVRQFKASPKNKIFQGNLNCPDRHE